MPDSPILGIPQVSPNQAAKEVTINDGFSIVERSLNSTGPVDMSAGDVNLPLPDYQHYMVFRCFGHTVARVLTVPASERFFMVHNAGTGLVTVDPGAGATVDVAIGSKCIIANDGTDLELIADSAAATAATELDDMTDVDLTTPPTDRQILVFDAAALAWKPATRGQIEDYTDSFTFALKDAYAYVRANKATALNATVPPNASVPFPIGTEIMVENTGAGFATIVAGAGVTVSAQGAVLTFSAQWSVGRLRKTGTNTWTFSLGGGGGGGGGASIVVVDESSELTAAANKLTFAGAGVTATEPGAEGQILITIPGGGGGGTTLAMYAGGTFLTSEVLMQVVPAAAWTLPAGLTGSKFLLGLVSTGSFTLTLKKNGADIGTVQFASGVGTGPTVTFASPAAFDGVDDILTIHAPASVDATAGNLSMTLVGS